MKGLWYNMPAQDKEFRVFAVSHTSRDDKGHTTDDASELINELKKRGVKKAGIEFDIEVPKRSTNFIKAPDARYVKAVVLRAGRNEIELVPLESTKRNRYLHDLTFGLSVAKKRGIFNFKDFESFMKWEGGHAYFVGNSLGNLQKILKMFHDHFGDGFSYIDIEELEYGLQLTRSLNMMKDAKKMGLDDAIMGGLHAIHLANIRNSKIIHVGNFPKTFNEMYPDFKAKTLENYKKHLPLIRKLLKIVDG
jgi:hypothetical protein